MLIIHTYCKCLKCKNKLEVLDEYWKEKPEKSELECPWCKYKNNLDDKELTFWEEEF